MIRGVHTDVRRGEPHRATADGVWSKNSKRIQSRRRPQVEIRNCSEKPSIRDSPERVFGRERPDPLQPGQSSTARMAVAVTGRSPSGRVAVVELEHPTKAIDIADHETPHPRLHHLPRPPRDPEDRTRPPRPLPADRPQDQSDPRRRHASPDRHRRPQGVRGHAPPETFERRLEPSVIP